MNGKRKCAYLLLVSSLAFPALAGAQSATTGAVSGVVRDTSGAVLPGVTVEAASPALIEKVRAVVADEAGAYKIVDLRPGVYTVTFTLPGFKTVRREGLELTTGFTANVNADMAVGGLEETITVTGATPVVDVQNVRQQTAFRRDVLEAVAPARSYSQFATVIPGMALSAPQNQDVGGVQSAATYMGIHGGRPSSMGLLADGFNMRSGSAGFAIRPNPAGVEETTVQTSGVTAEATTGTVQMNLVPREGSNTFRGIGLGTFGFKKLQAKNITQDLVARGVSADAGDLIKNWTMAAGIGGPLKKDKVWFYVPVSKAVAQKVQPGNFFNATQGPNQYLYTPDRSRPAHTDDVDREIQARITWQIAPKHKVAFHSFIENNCQCYFLPDANSAPEAALRVKYFPVHMHQGLWSHPATNRLLFEGGYNVVKYSSDKPYSPGVTPEHIRVTELSTGYNYHAFNGYLRDVFNQHNERFTMSYVTGTHAMKVGVNTYFAYTNDRTGINKSVIYSLRNGIPASVQFHAEPRDAIAQNREVGLFAQDQWTLKKMTLNLGVRFDQFVGWIPEYTLADTRYVKGRTFPKVDDVPNWKDLTPRLGVAYDVFGNGKTAIKGAFGRYFGFENIGSIVNPNNPVNTMVNNASRTWNDSFFPVGDPRRGDFVPQEEELGPLSNSLFGQTAPGTVYADDVLHGWNKRSYDYQTNVQVQQELWPGAALNVGYFRTSYGNFFTTDNIRITAADFDRFQMTMPSDPRLSGGGGQVITGLYDLNPSKFGQVSNVITQVSNFGKQTEIFNGIDATVNIRFGKGGTVSGGLATGSTATDNCDAIVDSPQKQFCKVTPPWSANTQVKFLAIYPLPGDVRISATYQNMSGIPITATYAAPNAAIAPSLGRNLSACGAAAVCTATATVSLVEPYTILEDRLNQLDLRFSKTIRFGSRKVQGNIDLFNIFNANTVLAVTNTFGPNWQRPQAILGARLAKIGFQFDF